VRWVLECSESTQGDRLVMVAIAEHADAEWASWPSIATIARETLLTERSVQRSVDRLIQSGELVRAVRGGRSRDPRYRPNRYVIQHQGRRPRHPSTEVRDDAHVTPRSSKEVTSDAVRGDICDSQGTTPTSPESKTESTAEPSSVAPASTNGHGPSSDVVVMETKVQECLKAIVDRRMQGREVRNPTAYRRSVLAQVRPLYEETASNWFKSEPTMDPTRLAEMLEPVAGNPDLAADEHGNLQSRGRADYDPDWAVNQVRARKRSWGLRDARDGETQDPDYATSDPVL